MRLSNWRYLIALTLAAAQVKATDSIPDRPEDAYVQSAPVMLAIAECTLTQKPKLQVTVWHDYQTLQSGTPPTKSSGALTTSKGFSHMGIVISRNPEKLFTFSLSSHKTEAFYVKLDFDLNTGKGKWTDLHTQKPVEMRCKRLGL